MGGHFDRFFHSRLKNKVFSFYGNEVYPAYLRPNTISEFGKTYINIHGCIFDHDDEMVLLENSGKGKEITLKTSSNIELGDSFSAKIIEGAGTVNFESDLTGLKK
ncbi:hypothetical protein D1614_18880 [Maribellus luteus]|uniref:Uncharacterized protein n=1 Tax=Maribellus luteus TaxID=2305463 RepID=A0A399SWF9_9BACT|nr:hypothetical protein D1614_18880 [Maribellus luteus]